MRAIDLQHKPVFYFPLTTRAVAVFDRARVIVTLEYIGPEYTSFCGAFNVWYFCSVYNAVQTRAGLLSAG